MSSRPPRRPAPPFRPRATFALLWFAGFFLFFALLAILPQMLAAARELPDGPARLSPEELALARETARRAALRGKLALAFALALAATFGLGWPGRLPGLGRGR
jgi:hypothetical protein